MAEINKQVNAADDDAYSSNDYGSWCGGEVIIRMGYSSICSKCRGIFRFPDISGLSGVTISVAYVEFNITARTGNAKLRIHAEDVANPDQILDLNGHMNAVRTEHYTDWIHDGLQGLRQSPSLVSVIQELADSYDPSTIQLLVDLQPDITEGNSFDVRAYEYGNQIYGAKLHIEYTAGGPTVVEGSASASGIGLATSEAKLDVLASALGNGIGLAQSTAYLEVLAQAIGSGEGLSTSTAYLVIPATASTQGVGLATAQAILDVLAEAGGSGVGLGSTVPYLIIPASAYGSGNGESTAQALLDILASVLGSGIGLGIATGEVIVLGVVEGTGLGSGIGTGIADALLRVFGQTQGSGEGLGSAEALLEVIAEATGEGIGLSEATGQIVIEVIIVEGEASGLGIGTALTDGTVWFIKHLRVEPSRLEIIRLKNSGLPLYREIRRS